ncbi:MAG: FimV/HubP family polar landmark protein [Pseudomonadota bacterium]
MAKKKLAAAILSLGCLSATSVYGLGLGELTLESFLNEPFRAKVDLLNVDGLLDDQIRIRLATSEDFDRMGVDRAYFLTSLKFEVTVDDGGDGYITVVSEDPVLEPYLDFIIEARWPSGRLLREYTVLIDPPVFRAENKVVSASQRVAEVEGLPPPDTEKKSAMSETGTRVDVRQSNLAPGEMPRREFWAETTDTPIPGSRYMIRRDETLWTIASRARPEGVGVQQTMLEIQRLNPDAFLDGNINRIKAGYIVYLPEAADINAAEASAVIAEVQAQNQEWREGRSSLERRGLATPSLRISADPVDTAGSSEASSSGPRGSDMAAVDSGGAMMDGGDAAPMSIEGGEVAERLRALEDQVATLQRIVDLKDDQIAALQDALSDGSMAAADAPGMVAGSESDDAGMDELLPMLEASESALESPEPEPESEPVAVAPAPAPAAPRPAPAPVAESSDGGVLSLILYGLGALVLALVGLFVWRRRQAEDDDIEDAPLAREPETDIFAGVELSDQDVEVRENGDSAEPLAAVLEEPAIAEQPEEVSPDNRGYGERKHDEYADDVDTGDALAEAEIYIAYGRYPQARELLRNAIASEPGNPAYHLKLMEIASETGDRDEMEARYAELQAIGDNASLAAASALMGDSSDSGGADPLGDLDGEPGADLGLEPSVGLGDGDLESLDAEFAGLEIEAAEELDEELDLSADFEQPTGNGEELVIADEGNEMSTKLDLARAYLDMGDGDGARQILEEVMAAGSAEQQQEAQSLLDRIG